MEFKATALLPPYHHSALSSLHHSIAAAQRLESDRMPRRFHFDRIENPIRVFPLATEVISYSATDVTLDVDSGASLQFLADLFIVAGIDDCIDIHMTG